MRILITTGIYPPEIGGPATYTVLMEKELPKKGISVIVLPFRAVKKLPKWIKHFVFFCKVLNLGRKVDLLYTQDPVSVGFPTMIASKILRKPFMIRVAGDYAWEQASQYFGVKENIDDFQNKKYGFRVELLRFLQKITVRMADKVITPSKYFGNLVSKWNPEKDNVATIYNGIDLFDDLEIKDDFKPKTIISAGRLVPWKGFDFLIKIMKDLPNWELYIVGDGPDKEKLAKIIESLGLTSRVFLLGKMERQELIQKIRHSKIFVLNTSFESFSFQIVEAMAVGTPVISTNIGNISEIIEDGKEGLLVAPGDKIAMLNAIEKLSVFSFRAQIISNAKDKSKFFSVDKTMDKTAEVIFSLIYKI